MITSPSVYLSELIREVMPADHQNVMVIPNGIEATRFTRGEKSFYIVSSGRLLPRKGFKELIIAVRELDIPGGLHILGDGPIRAELESLAEGSKTPVTFHGWMDNRSPAYMKMLANASVYCLVSARENASISILEAMASGCAVITSDGSGCPEMVGDAGILVPHGQPDAIRKALVQLSTSPELCEQLSLQAIRRVKEIYDWDQITARFLTLLQQHTIAGRS